MALIAVLLGSYGIAIGPTAAMALVAPMFLMVSDGIDPKVPMATTAAMSRMIPMVAL